MKQLTLTLALAISLVSVVRSAEYYVAPNGNDDHGGAKDRPWQTIGRAAEALLPGDTCFVLGGTYRETVLVERSGEEGRPVRFVASPGATVVISGTQPIEARWQRHQGSVYKAAVDVDVGQLFVDGRMMVEARWPNQPLKRRWDKATWAAATEGSRYGRIVDPRLAETGVDWTGALAVLNVGAWQTFLRQVENHGRGKDSFEYAQDLGRRHEAERTKQKRTWPGFDHYFLIGKLEALDSPGEWFFDRPSKTLYLWPPDGNDPSGRQVEAKTRAYGFVARRKSHVRLDGFRFFAATLLFEESDDCLVENCRLDYPTYAVPPVGPDGSSPDVPQACRRMNRTFLGGLRTLSPTLIAGNRNLIRNCRLAFSEAPGILLTGAENTVENCLVHDVDWRGLGNGAATNCAGVHLGASARSVFRRNTVHHVGSSEGVVLPHSGPFLCELNHVHHGGLVQCDGGLLQCAGIRLAGSTIRYNWVHDHHAFRWGGIGIRGDDLTRNLLVHHNVAWNCPEKGIMIKGDHNRAYNNTCVGNALLDLVLWSAAEPFKEWAPAQWDHLVEKQNLHSEASNNLAPVLTGQMPHEIRRAGRLQPPSGRLSHNHHEPPTVLADAKKLTFRKPRPPLVAPERLDFRPVGGSPLVDAGRPIDGITDGHAGKAPDVGAYEYGAQDYWIPGHQAPQASMPIPPHGSSGLPRDVPLIWLGGRDAVAHHVYLGAEPRPVADADRSSAEFAATVERNLFAAAQLAAGATCYWRVDAVLADGAPVKGDVWTFTVESAP